MSTVGGLDVEDALHRRLAEGVGADDHAAVVVLQGAGEDLRGRGRAIFHQHRDVDLA